MKRVFRGIAAGAVLTAAAATAVALWLSARYVKAADPSNSEALRLSRIERGAYLVTVGGCNDCHTPFKMGEKGPEPDMTRMLSGHPHDLVMPPTTATEGPWVWRGAGTNTAFAGPWGVSYARNLTPDPISGIGIWDEARFIKTIRTGKHWGESRPIMPPMPWQNYAQMTDEDLKSVYAYLRSIPPIRNEVPDWEPPAKK